MDLVQAEVKKVWEKETRDGNCHNTLEASANLDVLQCIPLTAAGFDDEIYQAVCCLTFAFLMDTLSRYDVY